MLHGSITIFRRWTANGKALPTRFWTVTPSWKLWKMSFALFQGLTIGYRCKGYTSKGRRLDTSEPCHERTLSPLRCVPAEILAMILRFALQMRKRPSRSLWEAPIRGLSMRIEFWNATSLSTSSLWRGIHIGQDDFAELRPRNGQAAEARQHFAKYFTSWFSHTGRGASLHLAVSPIFGVKPTHILEVIQESNVYVSSLSFEGGETGRHFREYVDLTVLSIGPAPTSQSSISLTKRSNVYT
ncbi:hypothetical protein BKA70DRAFT_1222518 [Coprinopsis sp. MPI-PUGE-AT-0042]|nr:hypothetical protein BKA70DRAFT_1222518 [Coprinopsis sp. MPI-PUGE-AT-0042]